MLPLFQIENLIKKRKRDAAYQLVIKNLIVMPHARLALLGPSGCGKSTTLDILGLTLAPDCADRFIFSPDQERNIGDLWANARFSLLTDLRRKYVGYVLQSGELLPFLTAGENITLIERLNGLSPGKSSGYGRYIANELGIGGLWNAMPHTLSVGERQRVAIARALASRPHLILADEPTAALDPLHAKKVMKVFLSCIKESGSALILATHDAAWAQMGGLSLINISLEAHDNEVWAVVDAHGEEL